jgi:hypothetical protein
MGGWGYRGCGTMYTDVNKFKNNKIKGEKKLYMEEKTS